MYCKHIRGAQCWTSTLSSHTQTCPTGTLQQTLISQINIFIYLCKWFQTYKFSDWLWARPEAAVLQESVYICILHLMLEILQCNTFNFCLEGVWFYLFHLGLSSHMFSSTTETYNVLIRKLRSGVVALLLLCIFRTASKVMVAAHVKAY